MISFDQFCSLQRASFVMRDRFLGRLVAGYDFLRINQNVSVYQKVRGMLHRACLAVGLARLQSFERPWRAELKHAPRQREAATVLLWAVGLDSAQIRSACLCWRQENEDRLDLLPVLLTDCADFAFYSRLGWQVEYLPRLGSEGDEYLSIKSRYLAWRYRSAKIQQLAICRN